jgi:hypothetical protein
MALTERLGWRLDDRVNYRARGLRHGAYRDRVSEARLIAVALDPVAWLNRYLVCRPQARDRG